MIEDEGFPRTIQEFALIVHLPKRLSFILPKIGEPNTEIFYDLPQITAV